MGGIRRVGLSDWCNGASQETTLVGGRDDRNARRQVFRSRVVIVDDGARDCGLADAIEPHNVVERTHRGAMRVTQTEDHRFVALVHFVIDWINENFSGLAACGDLDFAAEFTVIHTVVFPAGELYRTTFP